MGDGKKPAAGSAQDAAQECTVPRVGAEEPAQGGWPWYAWALVVAGALCVIGGLVYAFYPSKDKKPKKEKRAVKNVPAVEVVEAPAPAPVAMPTPVITTSMPMPSYTYAAPVQYAAPASVSYAAPVQYAAPVYGGSAQVAAGSVAYAAPTMYAAPAGGLFNALDANGDGVITRQEFQAMVG